MVYYFVLLYIVGWIDNKLIQNLSPDEYLKTIHPVENFSGPDYCADSADYDTLPRRDFSLYYSHNWE